MIPKRKWEKLSDTLLSIGGKKVIVPPSEPDLATLLSRGKLWKGKVLFSNKKKLNNCHAVSAWLWNRDKSNRLITGYALTEDDNLWRQHTFVVQRDGVIIEPTPLRRKLYYGVELKKTEAKKFFDKEKQTIERLAMSRVIFGITATEKELILERRKLQGMGESQLSVLDNAVTKIQDIGAEITDAVRQLQALKYPEADKLKILVMKAWGHIDKGSRELLKAVYDL